MGFNGSGVFTRLFSWVSDKTAGIKITASRMDQEFDNFATGLSNCLTRDGQGSPSAPIPFNSQRLTQLGNATADTDGMNRQTSDSRYIGIKKGDDIPSASSIDLGAATGPVVAITGTTTITSFGTAAAGITRHVIASGAFTLTHNATSLILPTSANITTAAGDTFWAVSLGSGNWRVTSYQKFDGHALVETAAPTQVPMSGQLFGMTLSNNAIDATNDIDIASGQCSSDATTPVLMALSSTMTKRLDALWVAGTNQGGLDTGGKSPSTWYYVWIIRKDSDGSIDALFSASSTSPTMPSGYTHKRRIGAIHTSGTSTIEGFVQDGDYFMWKDVQADWNGTVTATPTDRALTVPPLTGIMAHVAFTSDFSSAGIVSIYHPDQTNGNLAYVLRGTSGERQAWQGIVRPKAGSVRVDSTASVGTGNLNTMGYYDNRGRLT